jgi:hypothetical protein
MINPDNAGQCPNCGTWNTDVLPIGQGGSRVRWTEPVFVETPDPHYEWSETHKCACGTEYTFKNGT